jgi:hypothetical protein
MANREPDAPLDRYDADAAPDPEEWLLLDEQERILLVEEYHRIEKVSLPNRKAHAVFHTVVENQIALGLEPVTRAMRRLSKQGLSRHDCVHAIGWVLSQHIYEISTAPEPQDPQVLEAHYNAAVERLNAADWLKSNRD